MKIEEYEEITRLAEQIKQLSSISVSLKNAEKRIPDFISRLYKKKQCPESVNKLAEKHYQEWITFYENQLEDTKNKFENI